MVRMEILDLIRGRPVFLGKRTSLFYAHKGWPLTLTRCCGAWRDSRTWLNVIRLLNQQPSHFRGASV